MSAAPLDVVRRAVGGVRWYLREATGEARWDAYLERCRLEGREPLSRREWERHRADQREHLQHGRCC